ncbi:hypothetical protein L0Z72_05185 [candidate division KSB1 bacterium]|nr:hypothetical protein [candidate division KSB1 bacterium]
MKDFCNGQYFYRLSFSYYSVLTGTEPSEGWQPSEGLLAEHGKIEMKGKPPRVYYPAGM